MVQELVNFLLPNNIVTTIFYKIIYMSIIGSFVGISILIIRKFFDTKISPKWKCVLWTIFLITLLVPFRFEIKTNLEFENKFINNLEAIPQIANVEKKQEDIESSKSILDSNLIVSDLINKKVDEEITENNVIKKQQTFKDTLLLVIIPYVWSFIVLGFIVSFVIGYFCINKKIKNNKCEDIIINTILKKCLDELKINKNIKIYYQDYNNLTSIFGIFNSKILISREVLNLDDDSIKYIFIHELAHFKRKDLIFNLIMLLILSIHFFNPIVWYIFKKIREDIELAADEFVIRKINQNEIKQYGLTLIHMLELNQTNNYAMNFLCMSDTERNMGRRIKMIKNPLKNKFFSAIFVVLLIIIIASIVFIKATGKENPIIPIENEVISLSQNYEHLWSEPKEYTSLEDYKEKNAPPIEYTSNEFREVSDDEKAKLISEDDAKKIGKEIINKIGYTTEDIKTIELEKNGMSSAKYDYQIRTTNGLRLNINAENGEFLYFLYNDLIKERFENEKLSDEELKNLVLNLYDSFDFLNQDYEFYTCEVNITAQGVGDANSSNYKQYTKEEYTAKFYEKQASGVINKYNGILIRFFIVDGKALISGINCYDEIEGNQLYSSKEYIQEDNKVELTEQEAIKIAKDKDSSISNNKIKKVRTELISNMINYQVWAWEKGYSNEELSNRTEPTNEVEGSTIYPKYYYDKYYVRNTYEVVIMYEIDEDEKLEMNIEEKFGKVYYIDATTGEILGGRTLNTFSDIRIENDYLFDEEDNYTCYKTTYYDKKTNEKIWEYERELSDEIKAQFYIKKDEKPNTVSYNIY